MRNFISASVMPRKMKNIAYIIITCWLRRRDFSSWTSFIASMLAARDSMTSSTLPPDLLAWSIMLTARRIVSLFLALWANFSRTFSSGMFQLIWLFIFLTSSVRDPYSDFDADFMASIMLRPALWDSAMSLRNVGKDFSYDFIFLNSMNL